MLLEREEPLAELSRTMAHAIAGHGSVVAILGEAGIGKTSLLDSFARSARDSAHVFVAGCEALFTPRPFGPLYDIAADLGLDMDLPRERLFPSVIQAAGRRPSVLIVEDVHWADRATLDLLKYLGRRIDRAPVMMAISYRDDEIGPDHPLISLLGDLGARVKRIRVEALSRDAVGTLAGERGAEIYELTRGNPFYVTEVLAAGAERVPPTVRDAILARLAKQPPEARRVIEHASLIPGRAETSLLDAPVEHIETAARSGLVRIEGDALVFRHELGRRAVEDSISDVRRIPMHRAILDRLTTEGEPSQARLAHHAAGARDAAAIARLAPLAAAEAARASAHREAAAHYRIALQYSGSLSRHQRAVLLDALAYECYLTEQLDEALQRRIDAMALWRELGERVREGDNLRWQSRLNWFLGRNAEARRCAIEAIEILEESPAGRELAMAYSNQSQLHMLSQECDEAIRWGSRAIALATDLGDQEIVAHALNNVGTAEVLSRDESGYEKLERSLRISLEHGLQEHAARAFTNIGTESVRRADYERGGKYLGDGITYSRDRDLDSWVLYMRAWRARLRLETGRWEEAAADAEAVLGHRGGSAISRIPALTVLGRVRSRRGDPGAREVLDEAHALAARTGEFQRIAPVAAARAEAAWLRGDTAAAVEEVRDSLEISKNVHEPWARGDLAMWMWRGGALDVPTGSIAEPYLLLFAGRPSEAALSFESFGRPYEAAIALAEAGDVDSLQRAARILETLGDGTVIHTIRGRLRALGVRGPRESTRANPAGLTAREVEVLRLLDEGLRNADIARRLFVSAKTVDHHVSSVLSKLGVRTRSEAARLYRSQYGEPRPPK